MNAVRAPLHAEELKSLHLIAAARKSAPGAISPEHRKKLLGFGYASLDAGAIAITPVGQAKLVYETTRAEWFPPRA